MHCPNSSERKRTREFERRRRDANREVIQRGQYTSGLGSWCCEVVTSGRENYAKRLKSAVFYWAGVIAFMSGLAMLHQEYVKGAILALALTPCLMLYPMFRFLFGETGSADSRAVRTAIKEVGNSLLEEVATDQLNRVINKARNKSKRR